ncbi:MAG: hypothetical protein K0R54_5396 [Clostridiaceae bacterium]|jgi:hypothetical protein|nr:hypothetical protein [Clostridiaceae bacterium]
MKKKVNDIIYELNAVDIYKMVLSGELKRFPNHYWDYNLSQEESKRNASKILKYLIEDILHWDKEQVKESFNTYIVSKYKLQGMLVVLFNGTIHDMIENAYPNKIKPWELKKAPNSFWNLETSKLATIWMIEEKLKWSREDICSKLTKNTFIECGLFGAMDIDGLDVSPYKTINNAYPGEFKPWELKMCPMGFWNERTAGEAVRWLVEEKLKLKEEEIVNLRERDFFNNSIRGAFEIMGESIVKTLNAGYPGKYIKIGNIIYTADKKYRKSIVSKNNNSNFTGVVYVKKRRRWIASVNINGKTNYLGNYKDYNKAIECRMLKEKELLEKSNEK